MEPYLLYVAVALAYLLGSLSFGVVVSRAMGLEDPRAYGSGNPGATNVLRSGNKLAAFLTLLLDALKGYLPVMVVLLRGPSYGMDEGSAAMVGLAAFMGHLWPVFFRFKGGKGVATAAGVLFALNPLLGLLTTLTWIAFAFFFRYSSLASISCAMLAPLYQLLIWKPGAVAFAAASMGLLLIWRHGENISKLLAGTESRLGSKVDSKPKADAVPVRKTQRPKPHQHKKR